MPPSVKWGVKALVDLATRIDGRKQDIEIQNAALRAENQALKAKNEALETEKRDFERTMSAISVAVSQHGLDSSHQD